jgi:hypothetical protein
VGRNDVARKPRLLVPVRPNDSLLVLVVVNASAAREVQYSNKSDKDPEKFIVLSFQTRSWKMDDEWGGL